VEIDLKIKRPYSGVAKEPCSFRMLIPSISKAQRNYFGVSSAGTVDYRNGADVRPKFKLVLKGNSCEVLKKKSPKDSEAETIFSRLVVHSRKN
jgi:hypothetical protein